MRQDNRQRHRIRLIVALAAILVVAVLAAVTVTVRTRPPLTRIAHAPASATPARTAPIQEAATPTAGPSQAPARIGPIAGVGAPCGVSDPASIVAPTHAAPARPAHLFAGGPTASTPFAVSDFAIFTNPHGPDEMYILDAAARTVHVLSILTGQPMGVGAFSVPWRLSGTNLALDTEGAVYLAQYPDAVVKLTPAGQTVWTYSVSPRQGQVAAIYGVETARGFRLGVVQSGAAGALLLDERGHAAGRGPLGNEGPGLYTQDHATGDILMTDGRYVRRYGRDGSPRLAFGSAAAANDGGPFHFYQLGGAATAPNGTVYIADAGRGIEAATRDGLYEGVAPESAVGTFTAASALAIYHGALYYATSDPLNGRQSVSRIALSDLRALVATPRAPQPVLGYGAGLVMTATENYVAPGQTPAMSLTFDPWWASHARDLRGTYTVRSRDQVLAGEPGTTHPFTIPVVPVVTRATTTTVTALATAATTTTTTITSTTITPRRRP